MVEADRLRASQAKQQYSLYSNKADRGESWVPESWMTIPVGKRLWFYTGGKMGYYILNNGIELSIYDHDNNNLLSLHSSRAPTINNGISLATATPPQEYEIPFRDGWESGAYKSTYCKTQDGICLVNCSVYGTGVASENFIATLPTGFRPSATVCCAAHSYKNGIRDISETEILANGDIVVFSPIEFDYVSFSFVFVAEN